MKNIFAYTIKKYLKQFEEELGSEDPWNFLFTDIKHALNPEFWVNPDKILKLEEE